MKDPVTVRFALSPWPIGYPHTPQVIPAGTIVSAVARDDEIVEWPVWQGIPLPLPLPIEAVALDEEAALLMLRWHPQHWYRMGFGREIDREAIIAKAREKIAAGEWPRWA
jgi:hypothetical protein